MRHFGILWGILLGGTCCVSVAELAAQQPVFSTLVHSVQTPVRGNTETRRPTSASSAHLGGVRPNQPDSEPAYSHIAVIGAVKTPVVFETTQNAVPLKNLIEQAGGETAESLGTVRIMEHADSQFITNLQSHPTLMVTDGQVVIVTSRGGRPARVNNPRQPLPNRFVLISGLAPGPLLFNIGNQSRTFGDLLQLLGQSPEMIVRQQVKATPPQDQWMELDSLLVHNTVIHFDKEAVSVDGVRDAVNRGFRFEAPVIFQSPTAEPVPAAVPAISTPVQPAPRKAVSDPPVPASPMPIIRPLPAPKRVTTDMSGESGTTGIEATGSTILFDEPMLFPKKATIEFEDPVPRTKTSGSPPLMLPKSWPNPNQDPPHDVDPVRRIERTSANRVTPDREIITVSAEVEASNTLLPATMPQGNQARIAATKPSHTGNANTPSWMAPQSWWALLVTVGVVVTSVLASRYVSRDNVLMSDVAIAPASTGTPDSSLESDPQFLQRLLVNKVPLIEEAATLPPVDRLHGIVLGQRRLVIHDAHEGVAGPHFRVRDASDNRQVELRLRRLMRGDPSATPKAAVVVHTAQVVGSRSSRVSPLEKALRTVRRGDAT